MEEQEAHEARADEFEREADKLEDSGDDVERDISETREDWEAKKKSEQTAGALEHEAAMPGGTGEEDSGAESDSEDDSDDDD